MSENLKRSIYTVGTIIIVFLIATLFIKMLPLLLLVGAISYILIKIIAFIKGKKEQNKTEDTGMNNNYYNSQSSYEDSDDYTGEVIDVDYEEVDKKNG